MALVVSELRPGGMERVVAHLARALPDHGVQPLVICLQRRGPLGKELETAGLEVVALESMRGYDVAAVIRLARLLRRFRADVINVHDRASLPYVILANRISGRRPVVFSAHGLLMQDERPRLRDRLGARNVRHVTAVSQTAAQEYARLLGWRGAVDIIDNGVLPVERNEELRRDLRSSLGVSDETFVFLAVGNIKPEKGFEDLLEAAAILDVRARRCPFLILIAGGAADADYHRMVMQRQEDLCLNGTVRFLGFQSDMRALYSAADSLVLCSRKEGLPMVLLEAMSAGLPVVATEVGAVPHVIRSKSDGLLVPPASPERLAESMDRVLSDAELRRWLGSTAAFRVRSTYSVEAMTARYLAVYEQCASRRRTALPRNGVKPDTRPRVLMLAPLPPLTGGMATVAANLRDSKLSRTCRLRTMNNGKTTPANRTLLAGFGAQLRLLGRVVRKIISHRAEIIHFHTCALTTFWRDLVHMVCARLLGARVVWHLHDGTFLKFVSEGNPVKRAVIRWGLCRGSAVIVLSEGSRNELSRHVPQANWRVVSNGVPVPDANCRPNNGAIRFLFLGNLTQRKGAYDLVAAAEKLAANGCNPIIQLAGGEVVPGQHTEMERRIDASPCAGSLRLLGLITGPDKERALAESDCIVLPSYAEGLPMALLEGMAYGMPAIGSRVGSVPEIIADGVNGYLIDPGDVDALADRMYRIASSTALKDLLGRAARQCVEARYSSDASADKVLAIYREVLGQEDEMRLPAIREHHAG